MGMRSLPFFSGINRRDESCTSRLRSSRTTRSSVPLMKCFPDRPLSRQRSTLMSSTAVSGVIRTNRHSRRLVSGS
jgi:hypothetical protein